MLAIQAVVADIITILLAQEGSFRLYNTIQKFVTSKCLSGGAGSHSLVAHGRVKTQQQNNVFLNYVWINWLMVRYLEVWHSRFVEQCNWKRDDLLMCIALPFFQSKTKFVQVQSMNSVLLYGSRDAWQSQVDCWTDMIKRPCSHRRSLSKNGSGRLGSADGCLMHSNAWLTCDMVGSQHGP